jgi:DNA-directed RNA polymerase subunit RPC12/RpoP
MATIKTKILYKCRECGATSYQQVIDRGPSGALQATGQYRCSGCRNIFASIKAWWEPRRTPDFQPSAFQPSVFQPSSFQGIR